jgi:hypothetical protein
VPDRRRKAYARKIKGLGDAAAGPALAPIVRQQVMPDGSARIPDTMPGGATDQDWA